MVAFVIAYGVILFFLAGAAAAACAFYVHAQKRKLQSAAKRAALEEEGKRAFCDVYGNGANTAFVLLNAVSMQPVFVSPNVSVFFGVSAEELSADTAAYRSSLSRSEVRSFIGRFAEWDKTGVFEQEFSYGEEKCGRAEAFYGESAGTRYLAFCITDITKQKNERAAMKKELDAALVQAAAKSSFLSNMSHEIRTPMNGIMGMMSLARMNINDTDKVKNYLERAGDLSVFLLSMINDILDIAKIESGKMQLFETETDLVAFSEKIRNMFNGTITNKGIEFRVETVGLTARYFMCDELRLMQVVTNLVSNASKFTPAGGKIEVTFKQLDNIGGKVQLLVRVRDTGKGIAPENIRKIFHPFEQEEASTAHNYGGTGLGLAICDNIVRMMGGNIVIDSTLGKGTDFSVFLSLAVADVEQDFTKPVGEDQPTVEADFEYNGCRILLAEDNEINAEIAMEILESEGAKITHAKDGREAVEIFTQSPENSFDLLLLDIQMPRLNGRDAAREIRDSGKADALTVPIIALSADAFVEDVKLSEAAGMDGHVSKPVDFEELKKRAGEIIAAKKAKARGSA